MTPEQVERLDQIQKRFDSCVIVVKPMDEHRDGSFECPLCYGDGHLDSDTFDTDSHGDYYVGLQAFGVGKRLTATNELVRWLADDMAWLLAELRTLQQRLAEQGDHNLCQALLDENAKLKQRLAEAERERDEAKRKITEAIGMCDSTAGWSHIVAVLRARLETPPAAQPWYTEYEVERWLAGCAAAFGECPPYREQRRDLIPHAKWIAEQLQAAFEKGKQIESRRAELAVVERLSVSGLFNPDGTRKDGQGYRIDGLGE